MAGLKRHSGAISNLYFLPSRFNSKVPTADCRGEERVELLAESLVLILVIVALQLLTSPTATRPTKQVFHPGTRREGWRRSS